MSPPPHLKKVYGPTPDIPTLINVSSKLYVNITFMHLFYRLGVPKRYINEDT